MDVKIVYIVYFSGVWGMNKVLTVMVALLMMLSNITYVYAQDQETDDPDVYEIDPASLHLHKLYFVRLDFFLFLP